MAKLVEGISIEKLMKGQAVFEIDMDEMRSNEDESDDEGVADAMLNFSNMDLLQDDDNYNEGEPFDAISKKMTDLVAGGDIKKRTIRDGYGEVPQEKAFVRVDYNAYIEYEPQPFDSTYARKRKHEFVLNNGEVLPGLDIAVQSMKITEKAQFLISPRYAYGAQGCLGRVPKNSTILFEVELHEIINSGAILKYNENAEEKKTFKETYDYCVALQKKAKMNFEKNLLHKAVKDYNEAIYKLETVEMDDYSDQEKQQKLLLKLYTNILVCYTLKNEPKRGCSAANKIFQMTKNTGTTVSAKVYFNNAKCLRLLGDFAGAKSRLMKANQLEPKNTAIADEFKTLEKCLKEKKDRENIMSRALVTHKCV